MSADANKDLVRRFYREAINEHEIELILAEDDLVAAHQRWRGTHGGEFLGFAASGNRVECTSTAALRVRDGLIAEAWDEMDFGAILPQLGGGGGQ
jgi:predicted ester cyclase